MASTARPLRLSLPDQSLQVEFTWRGDRFAHEIILPAGTPVASIEGDTDDSWPPSPPVQQLSKERIGDADALLGVGAAGRSHWSLSVEIVGDLNHQAFKFDLACRAKGEAEFLGSTYGRSEDVHIIPGEGSELLTTPARTIIQPQHAAKDETVRWCYAIQMRS